jgi:intracellular sulfur oxidation DsrE/DsrF family protein
MFDMSRVTTHRRGFLGRLAAGAAAFGLGGVAAPGAAAARPTMRRGHESADPAFEAWLNKITGEHKMVFDAPAANQGFALAWARVFLNTTNDTYGTTDADNTVVIVLRHSGIPLGMGSAMWAKYKFGEFFKVNDGTTKAPAVRNPWSHPNAGELLLPGMAIDELAAKGVLFGICNVALTVYSGFAAKSMGMQAEAVRQDWLANLLPGVQVVPSGVIAVNRAQELGCAYCFAG